MSGFVLTGTAGDDTITTVTNSTGGSLAGTGADTIDGLGGNDSIDGGEGTDRIVAGEGADTVLGGPGGDTILSDNGNDSVEGGDGNDSITEADTFFATGNDTLLGGAGNDTIDASNGNDLVAGGAGQDSLRGGGGNDTLSYAGSSAAVSVNLDGNAVSGGDAQGDLISFFEAVLGSDHADTLRGRASSSSTLDGGDGNDVLFGSTQNDSLVGGAGFDLLHYGGSMFPTPVYVNLALGRGSRDGLDADTLSGIEGIRGTFNGSADTLIGSSGDDSLDGDYGNGDTLSGGDGADTLATSGASGRLDGGIGNDRLSYSGDGATLDGGVGNDSISLSGTGASLSGGEGADTLLAHHDGDTRPPHTLLGGDGDDVLTFSMANVIVSPETHLLRGDAGNDTLTDSATSTGEEISITRAVFSGNRADYLVTGPDFLTLRVQDLRGGSPDGTDDLIGLDQIGFADTVISADAIIATLRAGADSFVGTGGPDSVAGFAGNDTLDGGGGSDTIDGGADRDRIAGGAGNDSLLGGSGNDTLDYGDDTAGVVVSFLTGTASGSLSGNDTFSGFEAVSGGSGDDWLTGSTGHDTLVGRDGADTLVGNAGQDQLDGRDGADSMVGGAGHDRYVLDDAGDAVLELAGGGIDRVFASISWTMAAEVEVLTLTGGGNLTATGNALANRINGNGGANTLDGAAGADTLSGGAGNDRLLGDLGADRLIGDGGADTLQGGAGFDLLTGGAGADVLLFAAPGDGGDRILDFVSGEDDVALLASGYALPAAGSLAGLTTPGGTARFITSATGASTAEAGEWQVTLAADGRLVLDLDGAGNSGRVLIGFFLGGGVPGADDIRLI